jgi:hypothetical protein
VPAEPDIQNLLEIVLECLSDDDRDKGLYIYSIYLGLMSFLDRSFLGVLDGRGSFCFAVAGKNIFYKR